jgi:hypothetical protein
MTIYNISNIKTESGNLTITLSFQFSNRLLTLLFYWTIHIFFTSVCFLWKLMYWLWLHCNTPKSNTFSMQWRKARTALSSIRSLCREYMLLITKNIQGGAEPTNMSCWCSGKQKTKPVALMSWKTNIQIFCLLQCQADGSFFLPRN